MSRVAVVTGGTRGIGEAISIALKAADNLLEFDAASKLNGIRDLQIFDERVQGRLFGSLTNYSATDIQTVTAIGRDCTQKGIHIFRFNEASCVQNL